MLSFDTDFSKAPSFDFLNPATHSFAKLFPKLASAVQAGYVCPAHAELRAYEQFREWCQRAHSGHHRGKRVDIGDLTHVVLIRFCELRLAERFDPKIGKIDAYVVGIARMIMLELKRRAAREAHLRLLADFRELSESRDFIDGMSVSEIALIVDQLIPTLPLQHQHAILKKYGPAVLRDGVASPADVLEALHRHRGLRTLCRLLEEMRINEF